MTTEDLNDRILYEARDGRAYITFNRPDKKNAMTHDMLDAVMDAFEAAEADDDVRVVIFRSSGDDFCSGHDLSQVGKEYAESALGKDGKPRRPSQRARLNHDKKYISRFQNIFTSLKPSISLVKGYCMGAGLYIAEGSDLVIGADTARMGHPEQKLGLSGAAYFAAWEIMTMGARKAREFLLLADVLDAEKALAIGLLNKIVPVATLDEAGEEWAERIVRLPRDGIAIGKAATLLAYEALGITKQFNYGYMMHTLATNLRYEPDEYNFMKEARDKGVKSSHKERENFYVKPK
jgi:enoyl-CoA hydratase